MLDQGLPTFCQCFTHWEQSKCPPPIPGELNVTSYTDFEFRPLLGATSNLQEMCEVRAMRVDQSDPCAGRTEQMVRHQMWDEGRTLQKGGRNQGGRIKIEANVCSVHLW